jgi:predicted nucleotide-binding protein with TIR-like domain
MIKPHIFLGSSSEELERARVVQELLFNADCDVTAWWSDEAFPAGRTFIECLFDLAGKTNASLLIAAEDDHVNKRGAWSFQPRDNVIFEHGLFAGAHGRLRAAIAKVGEPTLPTDLLGVVLLSLRRQDTTAKFKEHNRDTIRKWADSLKQSGAGVSSVMVALSERQSLMEFMDEMDHIWSMFDKGWKKIHRQDYVAERNFADKVDEFFQQYHAVFSELIRKPEEVKSIDTLLVDTLDEARERLVAAWEWVAEGKMRLADEMAKEPESKGQLRPHKAMYEEAFSLLQHGKRGRDTTARLEALMKSVDAADEYMSKAQ